MDLFENHSQGEGGSELSESEDSPSGEEALDIEPGEDTAEAQPSIEEDTTGGGRTGDATPSSGNESGGNLAPALPNSPSGDLGGY